jgi:hypothetical protein
MKRIFLTGLQLAMTVLLLWWIFRDPDKRAQMLQLARPTIFGSSPAS